MRKKAEEVIMLDVFVESDTLKFGDGFSLSFQRTLRIPDDGREYPLPPGLGRFPILSIAPYLDRVPESWRAAGGFFIPMHQREALWISFQGRYWKPNAVKVGVGGINAISGKAWDEALTAGQLDYLVSPPQPWLDGINAGEGIIRQFVAMPLGQSYTVEAQVTGEEHTGGIQIVVYEPKPGIFPDQPPVKRERDVLRAFAAAPPAAVNESVMGLAAGGMMRQKIYPDSHGLKVWDPKNRGVARVHIVNSLLYEAITGRQPPPSPISAETYTKYGFPWFDLYDEAMQDIEAPEVLKSVKSVSALDKEMGTPSQEGPEISVPDEQIKKYTLGPDGIEEQ
jgi:hypothetical protein